MTKGGKRKGHNRGAGFLDFLKDAGNFIKDKVAPVALNVGSQLLAKRLGMGRKRKTGGRRKRASIIKL